jgi:hypothetical protein
LFQNLIALQFTQKVLNFSQILHTYFLVCYNIFIGLSPCALLLSQRVQCAAPRDEKIKPLHHRGGAETLVADGARQIRWLPLARAPVRQGQARATMHLVRQTRMMLPNLRLVELHLRDVVVDVVAAAMKECIEFSCLISLSYL